MDKERIYERVWGYYSEGDSSVVAEHIRRIRTKIAAYTNKSYIETVWGVDIVDKIKKCGVTCHCEKKYNTLYLSVCNSCHSIKCRNSYFVQ